MKQIEFGHYDIASNDNEIKEIVLQALKFFPQTISLFPHNLKLAKTLIPENSSIKLSSIIDYPYGQSDLKTRLANVEFAIKNGAKIIEMVAPNYYLCNRKYDKFREDISTIRDYCVSQEVEIRYVLEYRVFTLDLMYKVAQILSGFKINTIYPSTGQFLDDISDNIIATVLVNKKVPELKIIANGNIWNDKQASNVCKNPDIYGLKCFTINSLTRVMSHLHTNNNRPN